MAPLDTLPPLTELLDAERAALLDKELSSVAAALALARKLADMPRGKYDIVHADDPIATLLPHVQEAREIANLLRFDALNLRRKTRPTSRCALVGRPSTPAGPLATNRSSSLN